MAGRTRRAVTDTERKKVLEAAAQGMNKTGLCKKFNRTWATIDSILALKEKTVAITLTNQALEKANGSALTVGVGNLLDLLASEQDKSDQPYRVKKIAIDVETRECEAIVERKLRFTV